MATPEAEEPLLAQILPGLYLGSPGHARARGSLHEYEPALVGTQGVAPIRSIVNVSADEPNHFESAGEAQEVDSDEEDALRFEYFRCALCKADQEGAPSLELLRAASHFVGQALARGRPVLIHASAGHDGDAGAVLAAYLVDARRWEPGFAQEAVQTRCPSSAPSGEAAAWLQQLVHAEGQMPRSEAEPLLSPPAASEIIPGFLWLGNAHAATAAGLQQLRISHVVNATPDLPFADDPGVQKLRVPLRAAATFADLLPHWLEAMRLLEQANDSKQRVLVHCLLGRNRAAAIVVGYLMKTRGLSMVAALRQVRQQRRSAHPSAALAEALPELLAVSGMSGGGGSCWLQKGVASTSGAAGAPLALEDGTAALHDAGAFEAAVAQLRDLLPVPEDLCRDALARHSGNPERAANELLAWLEGGETKGPSGAASSSAPTVGPAAAAASSAAPAAGTAFGGWAGASGSSGAASSAAKERWHATATGLAAGGARKRSSSEDGTASSEPRPRDAMEMQLSQCFVEGEEQLPECIICGRSSKRGAEVPVAHPDLGWVHRVCLEQAGWT